MVHSTAIDPIVVPTSQSWDGNDGPWSTFSIHVGTPPQVARVLVSTTVGETWVISNNNTQGGCLPSDSPNCPQSRGALVNVNASSTWRDQGIFSLGDELNLPDYNYPNNYNNGDYGLDDLGVGLPGAGGVTLKNQVVAALATKDYYLGNLGVTSRPTNFTAFDDPHTSFLSSLKNQKHIPSLTFGYSAGNQYRLKKVYGSLTLGGYDQSRFTPNGISFQFATDISRDLVVGLQSITYSNTSTTNKALLSDGILTFVDATVPHIWLPEDVCTAFEKAFHLVYNSTVNRYLVNNTLHDQLQQQNASISFLLGNGISGGATVNITLPYAAFDLEVGPPIVNSSIGYFPLRRAENETQYTLGRTFLQESYLIVDYERSNFSISQSLFEDTPEKIVGIHPVKAPSSGLTKGAIIGIAVGAVALLALAGIAGFFFIRRRKQRRRLEEERKADAEFDPMAKPEMDGVSKPPPGELYAEGKLGAEVDGKSMNEMEGSKGGFSNDVKLHAEMEGSRGGAEMEGTKGGYEMQAGEVAAPVEMWAGPQGLRGLSPPAASRIPSSSGSGGRSPARSSRVSWSRRQRPTPSLPRDDSSGISSPTDDPASGHDSGADAWASRQSPRLTPPPQAITPPEMSSPSSRRRERERRGDDLTRRLESNSRTQSSAHLSVSSPTTDSRRQTSEIGADTWNTRFGSRSREHIESQGPSISSPSSASRSWERRLPATPMDSPKQEVSSQSERSSRRALIGRNEHDSWTSQVSEGEHSGGLSRPSSHGKRRETRPSGFF